MTLALPDAAPWPPPELAGLDDHPFDVNAHFAPIPADLNAAPLYLEALAEFDPGMAVCFPEGEREEVRRRAVRRHETFLSIFDSSRGRATPGMSVEIIDSVLVEYDAGFEKLAHAQQRPRCAFETAHTMFALLPHLAAARQVVNVARLRNDLDLQQSEFDRPLRTVGMIFRLARDSKPRGSLICQLVAIAIERLAAELVLDILRQPDVQTAQVDALVAMLLEHERIALTDPQAEGHRTEYVYERVALVNWERHDGVRSEKRIPWVAGEKLTFGEVVIRCSQLDFNQAPRTHIPLTKTAEEFNASLDALTAMDFRREAEHIVDYYREVIAVAQRPYREQVANEPQPAGFFLTLPGQRIKYSEVFARPLTALRMVLCLAAIRRWWLETGSRPPDLDWAIQSAGMEAVPADPFGDGPLRMTHMAGEPVMFSVGPSGTNDGQTPGPETLSLNPISYEYSPPAAAIKPPMPTITMRTEPLKPDMWKALSIWFVSVGSKGAIAAGGVLLAFAAILRNPWLAAAGLGLTIATWIGLRRLVTPLPLYLAKRRTGFACPVCKAMPPIGNHWMCTNCGASTDVFEPLQTCSKCNEFSFSIPCTDCGQTRVGSEWDLSSSTTSLHSS